MQAIVETTEANREAAHSARPASVGHARGRRAPARPASATATLAQLARILGGAGDAIGAQGAPRPTRSAVLAQAAERIGRLVDAERVAIHVADAGEEGTADVVDWRRAEAGSSAGWRRIGARRELVCRGATGVLGTIVVEGLRSDEKSASDTDADRLATAAALVASHLERDAFARSTAARAGELACLERSALVGRVASASAHDLNNVLTAVVGYLDLLEDALGDDSPPAARESLDEIRVAAGRGASIVEEVLAFARGRERAGRKECTDLAVAVRRVEAMLRRIAGRRIEFTLALGEGSFEAMLDAERLERVLANLVANARHAVEAAGRGGRGRITLELAHDFEAHRPEALGPRAGRAAEARDWLRLVVRDDGCGMSADVKRRAGERFFTTRSDGGGTGLGLAAAADFARAAGGRLEIETEEGSGSAIALVLPAVLAR